MEEKRKLTLSVHQLVDFLLREGDIDNRVFNSDTMAMGTKIHAAYQKKQGEKYLSEVALRETFCFEEVDVVLEGRADGIIIGGEYPIIDEIKSTVADLNYFYKEQKNWHYAQAKCYALMYCHKEGATKAGVRLTYISQIDDSMMTKEEVFSLSELEASIDALIEEYLSFERKQQDHILRRNLSASKVEFPYKKFRPGQREMAKYAYSIAKNGGIFFCEAPTGIGKTMSVLYPSIKAWSESDNDKIFYLTAKASGRLSCFDAMTKLYEHGLVARDSIITAKDKICLNPGAACNPDECPFAKGYYSKLREAVKEALDNDARFSPEYVKDTARRFEMCPFELQLDLSLWADVVIIDYNYLFDPIVYLERYFDQSVDSSKYIALIDEAHNLVDRGRSAYSEKISISMIDRVKSDMRHIKAIKIKNALTKLKNSLDFVDLEDGENKRMYEIPKPVQKAFDSLQRAHLAMAKENHPPYGEAYADLSRTCHRFTFLNDNFRDHTSLYVRRNGDDCSLELYCLDPSPMLKECVERLKGAVIFSAT
ncbi:MAG: hypothetical protein MJ238_07210, partial [Bacilli bacterium]|nr:hypothetical protein [Bacilli bacterium]